ncbi:MAG: Trk system potassium transporter TrkA [Clostridiales bacterium]|nr:Trk system potassium transporter TrkA [Clostridiales bacterium]
MKTSTGLKVVIIGCGKVGATLTEQLSDEGHDITIIDTDSSKVQELANLYDVMGVIGNGASLEAQNDAGVKDADVLIAVTGSDELNLLCCIIAKQFGRCAAIARVRTPDYSKESNYLREKLGLALVINPDLEAAKQTARILYLPTALEVNSFAHGQAELIKIKLPEDTMLDGMPIRKLGMDITNDILICAVERDNTITIPSGNFELKKGDIISFAATRKAAKQFLTKIGFKTKAVKNTLIIGGGRSAYYLAGELIRRGIDVTIVESDRARCERLSTLLPKAVILNGDGISQDFLKEAGIEDYDSVVPLTGIDEENIMLTLYAKQVSSAKVITKINRIGFTNVINNLNLGSVIYPKYITSEAIIAYVRARKASKGSNIETLYHLFDNRVEAIEFSVSGMPEIIGKPLKELSLKDNLLISCISHDGEIKIPTGQDMIREGDTVMIVTTHKGLMDIKDILK